MVMVVATMSRRPKSMPVAETVGILAFDAAKTMCRLISLFNSLSDEEITKLHNDVIKSKGVTYLNSSQENFLLNLAAAERLEELDNTAATVSRLGQKCSDLGLARFDLVYTDLKHGVIDLRKLQYNSRNTNKIIEKTEKLISASANLHSAMEYMAELETAERKRQRSGIKPSQKPNMEYFNEKLVFQRKQVQNFKETSLWKQTFDKTVGIMARLVCIVYARICSVFGAYIYKDHKDNKNFTSFGFGFDDCCLLEHRKTRCVSEWYEESLHRRVTRSGPISKEATTLKILGVIRFLNNPMPMDFSSSGDNGIEKKKNGTKSDKVLKLAPSSTVGGVGLSLRYANVILLAERCLHAPATVGDDGREALYDMLPGRLRVKVRAKLKGRWAKEEEKGSHGHSLAEGWREALEEMMEWLSPIAHDTLRWRAERYLEKTKFETKYTLIKVQMFDAALKVAILVALPILFGLWLGLGITGSVLVAIGYGFFTPWVSTFEAFRYDDNESKKFMHCIVDGTLGTIKGSCTVVRDFADLCYHSYPSYLKELRESPCSNECKTLRLIHVPGCVIVGIVGIIVQVPLFTVIAIAKSPYLLFKGWYRLLHDLISREGPFLETVCVPIAGLTIFVWPLVVIASILLAIFSSIFVGLYASIIVYQERSFRRGLAYIMAMVAEFDEYTNDWLYLREGTFLPKPQYRKKMVSQSSEFSTRGNSVSENRSNTTTEPPAMFMPSLAPSRSVRETIQEVKMVQIWGDMMRSCDIRGKELLDANVLTTADFYEWLRGKNVNEAAIVGVGLPCYSLLQTLLYSIKANSNGVLLLDDFEITHFNRPKDKLLDWFFSPIMVLKEQIRVIKLVESEVRYLEKLVLFGVNKQRFEAWDNGGLLVPDSLRAAQIEGISRRMIGMIRGISKLPTYRRKFRQVVKALFAHSLEKDASEKALVTHCLDVDVSEKSLVTRYLEKDPSGRSSSRSIVSVPSDDNV